MLIFTDTELTLRNSSNDKDNGIKLQQLCKKPQGSQTCAVTTTTQDENCNIDDKPRYIKNRSDHVINITVLGEARSGKTSLVNRLTTGAFSKNYQRTYGASTTLLPWGNKNSHPCFFRFMDTNEVPLDPNIVVTLEDRVDALHACFSEYVLIVYDITDHNSFKAAKDWILLAQVFLQTDARMVLVGNKRDLARKRQVHQTAGETLAVLNGMDFLETSALTEQNVHRLFLYIGGMR